MGLQTYNSGYITSAYLSISKQTSKEVIKRVLEYLSHFKLTVYTYDGENYDIDDLVDADYLLVLPPTIHGKETKEGTMHWVIGKGQLNEINYFDQHLDQPDNIYIISDIDHGIFVDELREYTEIDNPPDWNKYANLYTNGQMIELNNYDFKAEESYYELKDNMFKTPGDVLNPDGTPMKTCPPRMKFHPALSRRFI